MTISESNNAGQKTWLITGASSGIGHCLTEQLLLGGHKVAAIVRNPAKLDDLCRRFPETLTLYTLDLSHLDAIQTCITSIFEDMGKVDVVLSGAGYALVGAVEELSADQIDLQLKTNLTGPVLLIKAALPFLRHQRHGHIIQLSSEGGQMAYPAASLYHTCKWGLEGFYESLAQEIRAFGIAVTLVEPGRIKTNFDSNAVAASTVIDDYRRTTVGRYLQLLAMGRFPCIGDPDKVAAAIIDLAQNASPPLRLVLGSDSYKNIEAALERRLLLLRSQSLSASSTDFDDIEG